jgi:hypothetical protein
VARDAKFTLALSAALLIVAMLPSEIMLVFLAPVILGGLVAIAMAMRGGARSSLGDGRTAVPHPGYNINRIAVAGFPGLVLVGGFIWIFWFGAPIMRPVVVAAALTGCVAGLVLIVSSRRRKRSDGAVPAPSDRDTGQ